MNLEFYLRLNTGGKKPMSEWSRDIARRIKEKSEEKKLSIQKNLQDKKLRDDFLKDYWDKIGGRIWEMCRELEEENTGVHLACDWKGDRMIVSRRGNPASIECSRSQVTYQMEFGGKLPNGNSWHEIFYVKLSDNEGYIVDAHDRPAPSKRSPI